MANMHDHDHDHDHEGEHEHDHPDDLGGCGCGHDHDHSAPDDSSQPTMDVASQSLSNALRLSFYILSTVMVIVVFLFLVSGVSCVGADQVAVIKVFGKVVGHSEKRGGWVATWPYPVGDVQKVAVNQRKLPEVNDFWWFQTAADINGTASQRAAATGGMLRPGLDGALFTGDQNLLHAQITCMYRIENPEAYLLRVAGNDVQQTPESDPKLDPIIHAAICDAAIRLAAIQTADNIFKARGEFINQLQQRAQEDIDRLIPVGPNETRVVTIASISATFNWPAGAQDASETAQVASQKYRGRIDEAKSEAGRKLTEAAGPDYPKLVGTPWEPQRAKVGSDANLIGQYSEVREQLSRARQAQADAHARGDAAAAAAQAKIVKQDETQAEALLAKIDTLLVSNTISGTVAQVMSSARQDQANYIADVRTRENNFRSDLEVFKSTPELLLENRWAETRDQILQSKYVEKMYLVFGSDKTTFYINRDPNITKAINRDWLADNKEQPPGQGPRP